MSNDLFILDTDSAGTDRLKSLYPFAKIVDSCTLDDTTLDCIVNQAFTKYFYVIDSSASLKPFDFSFTPTEFESEYVHIWQNSDMLRLFNRRLVQKDITKFTDNALRRGQIRLKIHEEEIFTDDVRVIRNEPDVFILAPLNNIGVKFSKQLNVSKERIKIVETHHGLTTSAMMKILDQCESYYFYVVDSRIHLLQDFDFTFVPDHWDREYVHVWDKKREIRLFNLDLSQYQDIFR